GYQVSYTARPVTGRSLVASVQQYGKDLVVTSGSITSGTSLPAHTFTYQDDALSHGHAFQAASSAPPTPPTTVENVTWTKVMNVYVTGTGNGLFKPGGTGNDWNAGASSTRAISSG